MQLSGTMKYFLVLFCLFFVKLRADTRDECDCMPKKFTVEGYEFELVQRSSRKRRKNSFRRLRIAAFDYERKLELTTYKYQSVTKSVVPGKQHLFDKIITEIRDFKNYWSYHIKGNRCTKKEIPRDEELPDRCGWKLETPVKLGGEDMLFSVWSTRATANPIVQVTVGPDCLPIAKTKFIKKTHRGMISELVSTQYYKVKVNEADIQIPSSCQNPPPLQKRALSSVARSSWRSSAPLMGANLRKISIQSVQTQAETQPDKLTASVHDDTRQSYMNSKSRSVQTDSAMLSDTNESPMNWDLAKILKATQNARVNRNSERYSSYALHKSPAVLTKRVQTKSMNRSKRRRSFLDLF